MKRKVNAWLAVSLACLTSWIATWLTGMGFDALAGYMYGVWGVTGKTVNYAPDWIKVIIGNYAAIRESAQSAVLIALAFLLGAVFRVRFAKFSRRSAWGLIMGFAVGAVSLLALFLTGAVRLGASGPSLNISLVFSAFAYALSALALGFIFDGFCPRVLSGAKWRMDVWIPAALCSALTAAEYSPAALLNLALVSAVCVMLAKIADVGAACLFRLGLYAVLYVIMGASGGRGGIFECYPAALDWLSGEYAGLVAGFMLSAVLILTLYFIIRFAIAGGHNGRLISDKRQ